MSKIIIADASCLIALDGIDELRILKDIYSEIITTPEVQSEFGKELPSWVLIQSVKNTSKREEFELVLDSGEASCIVLALENPTSSLLIIDEKKGRRIAIENGLEIIGTLGILLLAKQKLVIPSLKDKLALLAKRKFRFNQQVLTEVLKMAGETIATIRI